MKITIDTKEDSQEEIKKVIQLLSALVEEGEIKANKEMFSSESSSVFVNMFGEEGEKEKESRLGKAGDAGFLGWGEKTEEKEEKKGCESRVVLY